MQIKMVIHILLPTCASISVVKGNYISDCMTGPVGTEHPLHYSHHTVGSADSVHL